eukprot:XP_001179566.2 PREDICTED: uncharacterized protein LOC752570 [Strongylocentrotus purpuratus]
MVAMTSSVDSIVDPANPGVIEPRDVSMGARSTDDEWYGEERPKTKLTFGLPILVEQPANTSDECTNGTCSDMSRNDSKARSVRPGRKYKPAQIQPFANGHHHQNQHQTGVGVGNKTTSSPLSSPRNWQTSLREGSNANTTPWNSSLVSPKLPSSPRSTRSPRLPRQLPTLTRSDSQKSSTNLTQDVGTGDDANRRENTTGLKREPLDHDGDIPVISVSHHIPLPTSSSLFQQIMTDFHERPSASLETRSPGDLMVRRSSLARTTLGSPPLLQVDKIPDEVSKLSELELDIELADVPGSDDDCDGETNTGESILHSSGNTNHQNNHTNKDKKSLSQVECVVNKANWGKNNIKKTSPRRHIKFPVESKLPTCAITDDDFTAKPGTLITVPTKDSLQSTASDGNRGLRTRSRLRSRDTATSVSGDSHTGSSEVSASSPERSPKPRRKISDQPLRQRPITPARSHHELESRIDMKTAGNIIRFITAAAASSTAPGLNRNQQLLPSDIRLPVVDPSGRLLHRNRDESMRLVKQAVDLTVESEEKSDVFSWDELRDCRYLRTRTNPKESRRNSLLGFNEV